MGLANPSYLPPPGVNAWARERSSFKLGDYPGFINVSNKLLDENNPRKNHSYLAAVIQEFGSNSIFLYSSLTGPRRRKQPNRR